MMTPDDLSNSATDDHHGDPPPRSLTLSVSEVAEILGISRSTAYESVRDGIIPSLRFRRRIVVPRGAFEQLLGPTDERGVA